MGNADYEIVIYKQRLYERISCNLCVGCNLIDNCNVYISSSLLHPYYFFGINKNEQRRTLRFAFVALY